LAGRKEYEAEKKGSSLAWAIKCNRPLRIMNTAIAHFFQQLRRLGLKNPRFVCDSRILEPGDIFVALKGERTDGHIFIPEVLQRGASLVIATSGEDPRIYCVKDPLEWIRACALEKLQAIRPLIIGVTGSYGKTTTKDFLAELLKSSMKVFVTPGNANSQVGLPLALMNLEMTDKVAILEMGMSQKGEIEKLVSWIHPDIALITSIGLSHVANFSEGIQGIAEAKGEILRGCKSAFFNQKTDVYEPFRSFKGKKLICTQDRWRAPNGVYFKVGKEQVGPLQPSIEAEYLLENLHLAIACALSLGVTETQIASAVKSLKMEKHRLHQTLHQGILFIDDSYNASPDTMKGAIEYLKIQQASRKIAVIGSMLELGVHAKEAHRQVGEWLKEGVDQVYCIGPETDVIAQICADKAQHFVSLPELIEQLHGSLKAGDCVLFKASRSIGLDRVVTRLTHS